MKMKQRARLMHSGDEIISSNMHYHKSDDDFNGEIQLHRIKPQDHFIEAQVQEGDTLQAIALRFYCSISELKRINHIHKDNEIFARQTIKVPVTPYSVLTELIPTSQLEPGPSTSQHTTNLSMHNFLLDPVQNNLSINQNNNDTKDDDCSIDCNTVVMNSTITPAVIPYTDSEQNEPMTEDSHLLPSKPKDPVETVVVKTLTSQSADFGLKWYHLVCIMLVLGIVIPIVFIKMSLEKPEHPDIPPLHAT